jgi:signal peptidase I
MGEERIFRHTEVVKIGTRTARRILATLLVAGFTLAAQAGIKSDRTLAAIISHTPAPRLVAEGRQLKSAEAAAAAIPGAHAFWGIGRSMEPLYATNTAVVVAGIDYEQIKKGMTIVYLKSTGVRVAHTVVGETTGGYLVQGVNNDEEDAELITADNLIGVVVQAYASADTAFRTDTEKRLVANGKVKLVARS